MSRVFVAEELSLGRKVVVKVLPPDLAATVNVERFRREIQLAARLQHPHIVPVLAAGISDGLPYYTMPFIEGESLRARLARTGELPVQEAARILRDVLSALSYAHEHGVVHRDIKPDNVLLTGNHAVVADFGVAKALSASTNPGSSLTSLGVALGTPAYMSPEQAAADPTTDHRADLYGVGAMAYEMLTGQQVFSARSPQAMLAAHAVEKPEPIDRRRPTVPAPLSALVMRSLEKHAADRQQSAGEMLGELEVAVTPSGVTVPTARYDGPTSKSWTRGARPLALGLAAILLVVGVAYGAVRLFANRDADRSVAVLTFDTIGADTSATYLAAGLADGITTSLSSVKRLTVVSRTAVRRLGDSSRLSPARLGEALGAAHLVAGSIQRAGDRLLVTVELLRSRSGEQLWTARYDTTALNVLGVQSLIAAAVAGSVAGRLLPVERTQVARLPTTNPLAYDHYLRGNQILVKETEASVLGAIAEYEAALSLDSTFTSARGRLAYSYGVALNWAYRPAGLTPASILSRALAAANSAIRSDSSNSDAWAGKGLALSFTGNASDVAAGVKALQYAVNLDPSSDAAHTWYAVTLRRLGRFSEAEQEYHRALAINPNRIWSAADLGFIAMSHRSFAVAVNWYDRALRIDSTVTSLHLLAAHARLGAGDRAGAVREAHMALALAAEDERYRTLATLAETETRAGDHASGVKYFAEALRGLGGSVGALPASLGVRDAWQFALAAVALGERDLAIKMLQRTTPRGPWLWSYLVFEGFDPIRGDPRFRAIMDEARPPGVKDPGQDAAEHATGHP